MSDHEKAPPHPSNALWEAYVTCGRGGESLINFANRISVGASDHDPNWMRLRSEVAVRDASAYLESMLHAASEANFYWTFSAIFLLETKVGIYEWSDPDYGGDNVIRKSCYNSVEEYCERHQQPVRDKGCHVISNYCGQYVRFA